MVTGLLSPTIRLYRGTRQGCPLSPKLFTIAIEVLAMRFRQSERVKGISIGERTKNAGLYAYNIILFVRDTQSLLVEAIKIDTFGSFSGLMINRQKSVLMPMDQEAGEGSQVPLKVVNSFNYLGINITLEPVEALQASVYPMIEYVKNKLRVWNKLPFSVAGILNLIKTIILPTSLYVLSHIPV